MSVEHNTRALESDIVTNLRAEMSYSSYLQIETLLSAQVPVSSPEHPDELLFIIQHQTTELWLKLVLHELRLARARLRADELPAALKCIARVKHIQKTLTGQWSVLVTLTPTEYAQFRSFLGHASGFQSHQYRAVEFILGNKNAAMLSVFVDNPAAHAVLSELLGETSVYDEFLRYLARHGHSIPADVLERDVRQAHRFSAELVPVFRSIYENTGEQWQAYEACEELVDLEDSFQLWRYRNMRTVLRIIGTKTGTGGSSGVGFLQRALDLTFFPELFAVRTKIR